MILEDTIFYWCHRTIHHPKIYPYIHKKHHEFYNTVAIAAKYAHPLEFIFGNAIPAFSGPLILGDKCHLATFYLWYIIRVAETYDGHCGYEFSWSPFRLIPFSGSSEYHNFHHHANIGNYSSFFSYWDTMNGTNKVYFKFKAMNEKKAAKEKANQEADKVK